MSSENQTNIRFSLKETVWFQKGQEVKEVRSLSLNPDITIQQFDEYVQVKGVLTLEGNYAPDLANQGDYYSLRELAPSRLVENVIVLEDGSCDLNHQFPVDISIPLTRITDLENLCVTVETFDYQLAEKGSIQIAADLCISGLHDNNRAVDTYHEQRAYEQYNNYAYDNDYRASNEAYGNDYRPSNEAYGNDYRPNNEAAYDNDYRSNNEAAYDNGYRASNEAYEHQEDREQNEQFQFFNEPVAEQQTNEQDNLYGSDWIQSLEEEEEQEEQDSTYPGQPTYLEVFRPEEVAEGGIEQNENDAEHYYAEENNDYNAEEEEADFEIQVQSNEQQVDQEEFEEEVQMQAQEEVQEEEQFEEVFRGFNISAEAIEPQTEYVKPDFLMNEQNHEQTVQSENNIQQSNQLNTAYNERPSFLNNDFNVHNYLNNTLNSQPNFLNNDYSNLQSQGNTENNAQKEIEKYEEEYKRTLEQSYQPYVNQQYQQAPFAYNQNQQPFYQNPYPQANQENSYANPNDVRQTPPYYAEYYQAQVEAAPPPELPKVEVKAEAEEVKEVRSVKSDNLLSSLFTGEGREESYSKLKLYLAQNGDTIESVAKKYNLQTQQLNRVNNLNDEFLSEGQIIYIPVAAIKQ
ncbi:stage VI sporulation protein D [Bacillus sp. AFS017336]|uniref:stage VI sporulation protein D n=1 Tax=Bacillus sp. AFS017336 TaxID=2033489 RepID=UPI000BF24A19|nr:stage VI sporulation protein D [Bacillus sp. AFS017336]PEL10214.1 stage VI sporulation protein D [Bacillus sp. AFS017336]